MRNVIAVRKRVIVIYVDEVAVIGKPAYREDDDDCDKHSDYLQQKINISRDVSDCRRQIVEQFEIINSTADSRPL